MHHIVSRLLFFSLYWLTGLAQANIIEVTLLGTGTPVPSSERYGPATLVKINHQYFLFDAGRGLITRLQQSRTPINAIQHVYFTHLHSDHITGFSDYWLTSWIWQRPHQLQVTGPDGTLNFIQQLEKAYQANYQYRRDNTKLNADTYYSHIDEINQDTLVYQQDGIKITAFTVSHQPVSPAFGYKIEAENKKIVISGDTTYSDNLIRHATHADLLIHEIAAAPTALLEGNLRLQKVMNYHTTPQQMITILNKTQPKYTLLNHVLLFGIGEENVIKQIQQQYDGKLAIGRDLMQVTIGDSINIRVIKPLKSH